MLAYILIHFTPVQNWIAKKVAADLSEKLHTRVHVGYVDFSLFNHMNIRDLLLEDRKKDTILYAGNASVKITDWFFLKDNATLHYVGLTNILIKLNRTDSIWNYQFVVDYFSTPPATSSKKGIQFDLKELVGENMRIEISDKWAGKENIFMAKTLHLNADQIDPGSKKITIRDLEIEEGGYEENNYTGKMGKLTAQGPISSQTNAPGTYRWNKDGWVVDIGKIILTNSHLSVDKETDRAPYIGQFDGQHFLFHHANCLLEHIHFEKDTLQLDLNLSAEERSGLKVRKLQTHMVFMPAQMSFYNLDLVLGKSHIKNYYSMGFENFPKDFDVYEQNVWMNVDFDSSVVHTDDLGYFAPGLLSLHRSFFILGKGQGTVDNLAFKKLIFKSGNTILDGDIAFRGLPDIKNTFIDYKGNQFQTNYSDLQVFVPSLSTIRQLNSLGTIHFKGNFTGFANDFVTYGQVQTELGSLTLDLNMKFPDKQIPSYSGKLSTSSFYLGKLINNPGLGNLSMEGKLNGHGLTPSDLNADFDGRFGEIVFNNYPYRNILAKGNFNKRVFTGTGSINDPNLQIEDFSGSLSLAKKDLQFNLEANIRLANLKNLGITQDEFSFNGQTKLNFTGNNIDEFLGKAAINKATLFNNGKALSFDNLVLESRQDSLGKRLDFKSNEWEGNISGHYRILELPQAFSVFLSRYFPSLIKPPSYRGIDQDFNFWLKTRNVDEYVQLIDKQLKGFDHSSFSGYLKLSANEMKVDAFIPRFEYDKKIFSDVSLTSKGTQDTLVAALVAGDIQLSDSFHFPNTRVSLITHNDISAIGIRTTANKTLGKAKLNAMVQTFRDGVNIHFSPSSFIINDKEWKLEKDGELSIHKDYMNASEVKFVQAKQEIVIHTEHDEETNANNIVADLRNVDLDDFLPFVLTTPRIEGVVDGKITLKDPFSRPYLEWNTSTRNFRLDNQSYGNVLLNGNYNPRNSKIIFNGSSLDEDDELAFNGNINLKDTLGKMVDISIETKKFNLGNLTPYLGGIFSNITGNVISDLKITGSGNDLSISGTVEATEGAFTVNYTQCRYHFNNESILFNPGEMDFGQIILKDSINNTATASGKLQFHDFFKDFYFDNINLTVNKPGSIIPGTGKFLLLNTTRKDNDAFYGRMIGDENTVMNVNGPVSNMKMNIRGAPSLSESSHIYLPSSTSKESSVVDYIEFIQFGSKMENELKTKPGTNILVDMLLDINTACKVDVILDETNGDIIKAEGSGNLHMTVGNKEPMVIRGQYLIEKGQYNFNYQDFVNKGFILKQGGTITWEKDDPYDASIKIDAEYLARNVDFSSIQPSNKSKSDVTLVVHLTNTLKTPDINFDFIVPPTSIYAQDLLVKSKLIDFTRDKNEMNTQVSSVLIFNSFVAQNQGLGQSQNGIGIGINTIGQILSKNLTDWVNGYLQKLDLSFNFDVSSSGDLNALDKRLQAAANIGFSKQLINDRLILTLGGNVDVNNPYTLRNTNTSLLLTPDFSAEYLVTKDGKLRVVGFRKSSVDFSYGQRNRQGISLTYRSEFDKLFQRRKKNKGK